MAVTGGADNAAYIVYPRTARRCERSWGWLPELGLDYSVAFDDAENKREGLVVEWHAGRDALSRRAKPGC